MNRVIVVIATALFAVAAPATGQTATDIRSASGIGADQSVWLDSIALAFAPELWFAPSEPSVEGSAEAPNDLFRADSDRAVVYYRLLGARAVDVNRGNYIDRLAGEGFARLSDWQKFFIRYYFYYRQDFGAGAHGHDVEFLDVYLVTVCKDGRCHLRVEDIVASAHDDAWYYNWLSLKNNEHIELPLTLLVEQGKHAVAMDRNRDGVFTPGVDVNRNVNDAWGVRDVMGTGFVGTASFDAAAAAHRGANATRALPPGGKSSAGWTGRTFHYALQKAQMDRDPCRLSKPDMPPHRSVDPTLRYIHLPRRLCALKFAGEAGHGWVLNDFHDSFAVQAATTLFLSGMPVPGHTGSLGYFVEARWDGGWLFILEPSGWYLKHFGGWLAPRYAIGGTLDEPTGRLLVVYTPSISRFADWHLGIGGELKSGAEASALLEGGIRFRKSFKDYPFQITMGLTSRMTPKIERTNAFVGIGVPVGAIMMSQARKILPGRYPY